MAIQQRAEAERSFAEPAVRHWDPGETSPRDRSPGRRFPALRASDHYVTVDEWVESTVGVVFAAWPIVDAYGLQFPGELGIAWFDATDLQTVVDHFRQGAQEVVRPLRIGDTFWVRGFSSEALDQWDALRDITSEARAMAAAAAAVVALGPVEPPLDDSTLTLDEVRPDVTAAPTPPQLPGGAATARPTI